MTDRCPAASAHDFVVTRMYPGAGGRALYTVECTRCEETESGYADEIPPARFSAARGGVA